MSSAPASLFDTFCEVVRAMARELDLATLLPLICRKAVEATPAAAACLRLLEPETGELRVAACHGLSEAYLAKGPVHSDRSLGKVMEGEPVFVADAWNDPRVEYPEANRAEGIRSILSVPLALRGEVVGELRLYYREPAVPEPGEVRFASLLAEQAALAIENARLIRMLRDMRDGAVRRSSERLAAMSYYDPPGGCR